MKPKTAWLLVAGAGVVALAVALGWARSDAHVARYICSPVPTGVHDVRFHTTDPFGIAPEFSGHLSFTAPMPAMIELIRQGAFRPSSIEFAFEAPAGPEGWRPADKLGPGARAYFRVHQPSLKGRGLAVGRNRRWSEVLVVDATGTNGFLTMWVLG